MKMRPNSEDSLDVVMTLGELRKMNEYHYAALESLRKRCAEAMVGHRAAITETLWQDLHNTILAVPLEE
jgi:hypothetical protein